MRPQNKSLAKARAARKSATPDGYYSGQCRMKVPKGEAEDWSGQSSLEKGQTWANGRAAEKSVLKLMKAIDALCPLEAPSWIVDSSGVTVIWGEWIAAAPTQVQAIFMMLDEIFPDGENESK